MRGSALAMALTLSLALPGPATADDDDRAVGVSLAYADFAVPEHAPRGAGLAVDYTRGVTDVIALRVAVLGAMLDGADGAAALGQGVVGLTYALDILKYVPYVDLGVGASYVTGGGVPAALHPQVEIGLGLDVLASRRWSYGPFARLAAYADDSSLVTLGLRGALRWGYF